MIFTGRNQAGFGITPLGYGGGCLTFLTVAGITALDQVHGATVLELVNLADLHWQVADVGACRSFTGRVRH